MNDATEHICQTIFDLKHPSDPEAIPRIPVMTGEQLAASLRPVPSELIGEACDDARLMAEWRNSHKTAFFTWITSTEASTRKWLTEVYGPNNRDIMFMLETPDRLPFGHLALYNFGSEGSACEFGKVLRGTGDGPRGGVTLAASVLLLWARSELNIKQFFLEVFSDNHNAVSLYKSLGFGTTDTIPLRMIDIGETIRWEKLTEKADCGVAPDGYALRMETTSKCLYPSD